MKNKTCLRLVTSVVVNCSAFEDRRARTFFGVFDGRFVCGSYLLGRAFGRKSTGRLFQVEEVEVELVASR
jgi:hypothetical protein